MRVKDRGEDWTPASLPPEPNELVEVKLADGTTRTAAWTGRFWWVKEGTVKPVLWRKRPDAAFGALVLK